MRTKWIGVALWLAASVCPAQEPSIVVDGEVADVYHRVSLVWTTVRFTAANATGTGTASMAFGLNVPPEYVPGLNKPVPLVLYLHGAGARGSNIGSVLQRQTPRRFAWMSQTAPGYRAFVIAPQVPSGGFWANTPWADGPYEQSEATYTDWMCLTEALIDFVIDPNNNVALGEVLAVDANDVDPNRIYVVGDSMGAYGAWDTVARRPGFYAATIAASGSGPKNKLDAIRQTPFWAIHGSVDTTVPNALPSDADPDGAGSLGMLALIDPNFDNSASTDKITLDDYASAADDPNKSDTLIYTELPGSYGHATVAMEWTTLVSGTGPWLFAFALSEEKVALVRPITSLLADEMGMIQSINGIDVNDLVLGTTVFPNPPAHSDARYHADKADNFDLSNGASGDNQPYFETFFAIPVTTIFLIENNGNDSGYFQCLDAEGNPIGEPVAFTQHVDYLKTDYRFFLNQQASGIMFVPPQPVYGIRIIKPDDGALGFDALSISAIWLPAEAL